MHELGLPRAEEATISPGKLRDYALNHHHREGRHKARVFASALGFQRHDWELLRNQILDRLPSSPVVRIQFTSWGIEYQVVVTVDGLNGKTFPVLTNWVLAEDDPPRLTSAWVDV